MDVKNLIFLLGCLVYCSKCTLAGYCTQSYTCTKQCATQHVSKKECGMFGWGFIPSWGHCTTYRTEYRLCPTTCYKDDCCPGYTGPSCSDPLCIGSKHCRNGGKCVSPGHCSCPNGFSLPVCDDINECSYGNNGCQHECFNTQGSYYCKCRNGYRLDMDQKSCHDVNECESNNGGCSHFCTNSVASYMCSCKVGFKLGRDGKSCVDIDNCENNPCQHNGTCIDGINKFTCVCNPGYTDQLCQTDVDECQDKNGGCEDICTNTNGSHECSCEGGRIPDDNGFSCIEDIDNAESQSILHVVLLSIIMVIVVIGILVGAVYLWYIQRLGTPEIREKMLASYENDDVGCEENDGLIVWDIRVGTKKYGSPYEKQ